MLTNSLFVDFVLNLSTARPYLFSNTLAPAVAGASIEVFRMLSESSELPEKLATNVEHFRTQVCLNGKASVGVFGRPSGILSTVADTVQMTEAGFTLSGDPACPIAPVMLGDARLAAEFAVSTRQYCIMCVSF